MNDLEWIHRKILLGTVTTEDFDRLIDESKPSSVIEKIRRRTQRNVTKSHIDRKGHQKLSAPNFVARTTPKLEPSHKQDRGRGKLGRKHSSDTIRKQHE